MAKKRCHPEALEGSVRQPDTTKLFRIMRLTALLLITGCMSVAAAGHSQNVSLSVKNQPIQKVFAELQKAIRPFLYLGRSRLERNQQSFHHY